MSRFLLHAVARAQVNGAIHAAINARRPFSNYFAGFPDPRTNPWVERGPAGWWR